jgi:hypothetical protein
LQQLLTRCIAGQLIDVLPDEVLLEIFDFYVGKVKYVSIFDGWEKEEIEGWQSLVHVCRRWRSIIFGSTIRLNLRLFCTSRTPVRAMLDVWPALPLLIEDEGFLSEGVDNEGVDNIVAALECSDRVDEIELRNVGVSSMENVLAAMQVPFPYLDTLVLQSNGTVTVIPDSFLDGYAPNLEVLDLDRIPIPGLPKLLSRFTGLTALFLNGIPHSGYFSPEELVTALSTLTHLQVFELTFESPLSRPDRESRRPPPLKHAVLPDLLELTFSGVSEYLEDLVARIDAPRLDTLRISFFNQIDFDTPQLIQFISRTPRLNALDVAHLSFGDRTAGVLLLPLTYQTEYISEAPVNVEILSRELDWQVSSLEQLVTPFFPSIFMPEDLYIYQTRDSKPDWKDNVEDALWLALLHPFTAVKNLRLSKEFAPRIAPALQGLVEGRMPEVLPTLQNIFVEELESSGPIQEAIGKFIAMRQLSGHPIAVSLWERDFSYWLAR